MSCVLTLQQSGYQQNGTGSGRVTIGSVSVETSLLVPAGRGDTTAVLLGESFAPAVQVGMMQSLKMEARLIGKRSAVCWI